MYSCAPCHTHLHMNWCSTMICGYTLLSACGTCLRSAPRLVDARRRDFAGSRSGEEAGRSKFYAGTAGTTRMGAISAKFKPLPRAQKPCEGV